MESPWGGMGRTFDSLEGDLSTEVLIIGGGMCGLLCAYELRQAGIDCVLLEADRIFGGITKGTTAKITSQHGLIYGKIMETYGPSAARQYLRANEAARMKFDALCGSIDCDYEYRDSYVYSLNDRKKLLREAEALRELGYPAELQDSLPLPFPIAGAVAFHRQAQFDPVKFGAGIAERLPIFEHSKVLELKGTKAVTRGGSVQAKKVLVTTHFPFLNKHGLYFLKLYQHRSYVLGLENAPEFPGMYVDEAQTGLSFRNYRNLLLLGGGAHRTGKQGGGWEELRATAQKYFPQAREVCHWAAQDCMSLDDIPYIGPYSKNTQDLFVATGFRKWGMTSSMVAAELLTDFVKGRQNPNSPVFSPSRRILHPQLAVNALESSVNLLTPARKRCPHLGCALKWNPQEHTWDCPCHGSRFTEDGNLIDNPATGDLK